MKYDQAKQGESGNPVITVIPATIQRGSGRDLISIAKRRVAAYARVSTGDDEQQSSYEAQMDFYTKFIQSNPDWEFVKVYADDGISGTNTRKCESFNDMVNDALDGKIDLIITKSVARFARNTVDSLVAVRKLREKGVEVYFETQNIYTLDPKSEMILTIMSSIAHEESRNISENVTWGKRKRMADGKVNMAYGRFLGYEKGEDGNPRIVEAEAEIVRRIYALFLEGETYRGIADYLTGQGVLTPGGKKLWGVSTVRSILQNEKYAGNATLQKTFTVDFLTKKTKVNEGEVPQYYVENSHPAIVDKETFELVQAEIRRRQTHGKHLSGSGLFFGKIICGECGGFYGSKVWHSADKYRRVVWQCNHKYMKGTRCTTPHITEEYVRECFVVAFNQLVGRKERYVAEYVAAIEGLGDSAVVDGQIKRLISESEEIAEQIEDCIAQNTRVAQNQGEYQRRYDALVARFDEVKRQSENLLLRKGRMPHGGKSCGGLWEC